MGRRKISIQQITDPKLRQITFNKRKNGLLKKAAEIALLCNVKMLLFFEDGSGNLVKLSTDENFNPSNYPDQIFKHKILDFSVYDYPDFFKAKRYNTQKSDVQLKDANDNDNSESPLSDDKEICNFMEKLLCKKEQLSEMNNMQEMKDLESTSSFEAIQNPILRKSQSAIEPYSASSTVESNSKSGSLSPDPAKRVLKSIMKDTEAAETGGNEMTTSKKLKKEAIYKFDEQSPSKILTPNIQSIFSSYSLLKSPNTLKPSESGFKLYSKKNTEV